MLIASQSSCAHPIGNVEQGAAEPLLFLLQLLERRSLHQPQSSSKDKHALRIQSHLLGAATRVWESIQITVVFSVFKTKCMSHVQNGNVIRTHTENRPRWLQTPDTAVGTVADYKCSSCRFNPSCGRLLRWPHWPAGNL